MTRGRHWLLLLAIMTACVLLPAPAQAQAQDGGWRIDRFDVAIQVAEDGTLTVTETIDVDFGTLSRRGIFRVLPVRYGLPPAVAFPLPDERPPSDLVRVVEVDNIRVTSQTAPDDVHVEGPDVLVTGPDTMAIRIGEEDTFITGAHRYLLRYEVRGAMNGFGGAPPELVWNVTGDGWPVPIEEAIARISGAPITDQACSRGTFGATDLCDTAMAGDGAATFRAQGLQPGEGMTAAVAFAPGSVEVPPPLLRERWALGRALRGSPWAVPLTVLTGLLVLGGVLWLLVRQGRDRMARGGLRVDGHLDPHDDGRRRGLFEPRPAVAVQYRPPQQLRPAQLGLIVDESVDPVDVSATVVDLAVRGHLRIVEEQEKRLFRTRTDWRLIRQDPPGDAEPLRSYERLLLDGLFADGAEVEVSELTGSFAEQYRKVQRAIYEDGRKRKWFRGRPDKVRARWLAIGVGAVIASLVLLVLAVLFSTVALAALPLVAAAFLLLAAHGRMPSRTPRGSALLIDTLGFKEFILTAEADRMDFAEAEQLFVAYLPYAVVFGAVDRWAERFSDLGVATATVVGGWYVGHGLFDAARFSSGLSDFSSSVGSSLSTVPSSGGGSSVGGGSFSGGGFGGGGGGSW